MINSKVKPPSSYIIVKAYDPVDESGRSGLLTQKVCNTETAATVNIFSELPDNKIRSFLISKIKNGYLEAPYVLSKVLKLRVRTIDNEIDIPHLKLSCLRRFLAKTIFFFCIPISCDDII